MCTAPAGGTEITAASFLGASASFLQDATATCLAANTTLAVFDGPFDTVALVISMLVKPELPVLPSLPTGCSLV